MSQTYNRVTDSFVEDAPNSNVQYKPGTEPNPLTGNSPIIPGSNVIGPEIEGHPGLFAKGPDFNTPGQQIQLGLHVSIGGDVFVCESEDGTLEKAYWRQEQQWPPAIANVGDAQPI